MTKFIIIADWQDYLWINFNTRNRLVAALGVELSLWTGFRSVHPRHSRYGNAQNVSMFSQPLINWLTENNIRFSLVEDE